MDSHTPPPFLSSDGSPPARGSSHQTSDPLCTDALLKVSPAEFAAHCSSTPHIVASAAPDTESDDSNLLRSFEMIFQLHQRTEELRSHLDKIDRVLLESRTVACLTERIIQTLKSEFDLSAARILFREDHPVASFLKWAAPTGASTIPGLFTENKARSPRDPYILDDLSGELAHLLFEEDVEHVNSALVAPLFANGEELGLLCLGSQDPCRYHEGMNTDLISSLADKTTLGIFNAWDHETSIRNALMDGVEGVYSQAFFLECLQKEFSGAWRNRSVFSLIAVSWKSSESGPIESSTEIPELFLKNLRAADIIATGDVVPLWVLLPHTEMEAAHRAADRLTEVFVERYQGRGDIYFGITEFSREAAVMPMLLKQAQTALSEAEEAEENCIVARRLSLEDYVRQHAARSLAASHS